MCTIRTPGQVETRLGWSSRLDPFILVLIIVLGTSFGSFFNVVIDRLPRNESLVRPASHCTNCGKSIPFYLNVPILSYIFLGGKCKYCKSVIPWHHLIVEIVTPIVFIALFLRFDTNLLLFAKYALLCGFLIPVFFIDLYHQLILDKLTIPMTITGIIFSLIPGTDIGIKDSALTGVTILALFLFIAWIYEKVRKKDGLGGGDIKLLAAMATYLGVINITFVLLFSSLLGTILGLAIYRSFKVYLPFGTYLAITTIFWLLFGSYFIDWYFGLIMAL